MDKGPPSCCPCLHQGKGKWLTLNPGLQIPPVWLSKGKRDELGVLGLSCTLGLPLSLLTHLPMFCLFLMRSHTHLGCFSARSLCPSSTCPPPKASRGPCLCLGQSSWVS